MKKLQSRVSNNLNLEDGIILTSIAHPTEKNIFKRIWSWFYFKYIYDIPDDALETFTIELPDKDAEIN